MKKLILLAILIFYPALAMAGGTVSVRVGNGIGTYTGATDDLGSWGGVTEWASVSTKSYRCIYPNLNNLPGSNKTVTAATWSLYYRYAADCPTCNYTLYFYEGRDGDSDGTPYLTYTGWQSKTTGIYHSFNVDATMVQDWIDTPVNNNGLSFDRGDSPSGTLVFGALDNTVLDRRPYLYITYTYTGDIPPPLPTLTAPVPGWSIKGDVVIEWEWSDDVSMDTSSSTVQIDAKLSASETWTTIANGVSGDALTWTWDTSEVTPGSYDIRIRSETTESVYSDWYTLDAPIIITSSDYSIVHVNNLEKAEQEEIIAIPDSQPTPEWFAAKGEGEAIQLIFVPHKNLTNVELRLGTFSDGNGHTIPSNAITLYVQEYTNCTVNITGTVGTPGYWPDALIPVIDPIFQEERRAASLTVPNFKNVPLLIDVFVPRDQEPGYYTGNLIVNGDGLTEYQMQLKLRVRNFTLPATASLPSTNLLDPEDMWTWHINNATTKDAVQSSLVTLWKMYRDNLLKYRLSVDPGGYTAYQTNFISATGESTITNAMDAPYFDTTHTGTPSTDLLTTRYNIIASWPKLDGATQSPSPTNASWQASWEAIWSDMGTRGWREEGYVYLADEPSNTTFDAVGLKAQNVKAVAPELKTLVTAGIRTDNATGQQSLAYYDEWIDIWVPVINHFGSEVASHGAGISTLDSARANGDEVWTYTSNMSISDSGAPGYFIDYPNGTYARVLNWLAWFYDLDGLLYFDTAASWASETDPYTDVYRYNGNGDGTLWYPGTTGFVGGSHGIPIPSNRLVYIRDGFEDYEYMKLLADAGKNVDAVVEELLNADRNTDVGEAVRTWSKDADEMQDARATMANMIEGRRYAVRVNTGD